MAQYTPIAETPNFIVLDSYTKYAALHEPPTGYQTESELENEFIADLRAQGYEYLPDRRPPAAWRDMGPPLREPQPAWHYTVG